MMEYFLMVYLHRSIVHTRVEEEFSLLLSNGANHRDVLVEYYSETTIKHIVLMEMNEEREVVITDNWGNIVGDSGINSNLLEEYLPLIKGTVGSKDEIIISNWENSPYITL